MMKTTKYWTMSGKVCKKSDMSDGHTFLYPHTSKLLGVYWFHSVRLSVHPSRIPCPICSIYSSGWILFIFGTQMMNSMSGCVACDDPWPGPISSRSLGLDLVNCVRSVVSTFLDGFFLYLAQMITIIRGCVGCYVFFFRIWKFEFLANFWNFRPWPWKKSTVRDGFFTYYAQMITSMRGCVAYNDLWPWRISSRSFWSWPWKSCLLCSIYSSWWIISIFGTNNH